MPYKDKDEQRKAQREWVRQRRAIRGSTKQGSTFVSESGSESGFDDETSVSPKRGKDIKVFADLPADVQETINRMSLVDGRIDQTIKVKRTTAAIRYQHLFPDRYEPTDAVCTGVVTDKPGGADYNGVCTSEWIKEKGWVRSG